MNSLVNNIKEQIGIIFYNMGITLRTCSWNADICGAPAWRYFYHTLHSCDKWFINPYAYTEPDFHSKGLDWPDSSCEKPLSREMLEDYFSSVKNKIFAYLDSLTDKMLYEKQENCEFTRFELILGQFRHLMCHIGICNGVTIAETGKYPRVVGLENWRDRILENGLFEE